ncbi:hypothetical protein AC1031_008620 [Aphanomyces cochlioides]|nr:hypothetical protein AC1031_008620 [Aphanomyces cochlioides]
MGETNATGPQAHVHGATPMVTLYGSAASRKTPAGLHTNMITLGPEARSRTAIATADRTKIRTPTDQPAPTTHPRRPITGPPRLSTPIRSPSCFAVTIAVSYVAKKATGGPTALQTRSRNKRDPVPAAGSGKYTVEPPDKTPNLLNYTCLTDRPIAVTTFLPDFTEPQHTLHPDFPTSPTSPLANKTSPSVLGRNIAHDLPYAPAKSLTDSRHPALCSNLATIREEYDYDQTDTIPDQRSQLAPSQRNTEEKAPTYELHPASSSHRAPVHDRILPISAVTLHEHLPVLGREYEAPSLTHGDEISSDASSSLPAPRAVFLPHQIEAILSGDFPGATETHSLDFEDRMYPIAHEDIQRQLQAIRSRRQVQQDAILPLMEQVLGRPITPADLHLLQSPAQLDDPQHWLDWFTSTLNSCEKARQANRDFSRTDPIAFVTRTDRLLKQAQSRAQRDHDTRLARAHSLYQTRATHDTSALLNPPPSEVLVTAGSSIRFSSYISYHLLPLRITLKIMSAPFELTHRRLWPQDDTPNGLRTILIKSRLPPPPPQHNFDDRARSADGNSADTSPSPPRLTPQEISVLFPFAGETDLPLITSERPHSGKYRLPYYRATKKAVRIPRDS